MEPKVHPALQCANLHKHYSTPALQGLSFSIAPGEFYALLGPNGAGKTTTLRIIAGLLQADFGTVRIAGIDLLEHPEDARMHLAYLADEPAIYPKLTPIEYLEFIGALWKMDPAQSLERAVELLDLLGLAEHTNQRCVKQKLALAGALLHQPALLMLDEPLTGLDAHAARLVKDLLRKHVQSGGSVLLTTHILEVAERLADRIGIISRGQLISEGTLAELRSREGSAEATLEDLFLRLTVG
jgi:ABC-2 type transport system ATP-binding protein